MRTKYSAGDRMIYVGEVLTMLVNEHTEPTVHYVKKIYRFLQDPPIG